MNPVLQYRIVKIILFILGKTLRPLFLILTAKDPAAKILKLNADNGFFTDEYRINLSFLFARRNEDIAHSFKPVEVPCTVKKILCNVSML